MKYAISCKEISFFKWRLQKSRPLSRPQWFNEWGFKGSSELTSQWTPSRTVEVPWAFGVRVHPGWWNHTEPLTWRPGRTKRGTGDWWLCGPWDQWFPLLWMVAWWRHQMGTFSALLGLCERNPPVTGGLPSQRPVTRSFDVFFDLHMNIRLSKQSRGQWFETPLFSLWRYCNEAIAWFNDWMIDCLTENIKAPLYWSCAKGHSCKAFSCFHENIPMSWRTQ